MTPPPLNPWVLTMLVPVVVVSFVFALYEKDMPASWWLLVCICLYVLPAWLFIDIAFVEWKGISYQLGCHVATCANKDIAWHMMITYSGLVAIEVLALMMVGGLALLRFRYLRRNYNW